MYWAIRLPCSAASRYHSNGFAEILGKPLPGLVHHAEVGLGPGHPLFGGKSIPTRGFGVVLGYASSHGVRQSKVELPQVHALVRRGAEPEHRSRIVLLRPRILMVETQLDLGGGEAVAGGAAEQADGGSLVPSHASAIPVETSQLELRICVVLSRRQPIPPRRLARVFRDTFPVVVHGPEYVLGRRHALFRRLQNPIVSLGCIRRNTAARQIDASQRELRLRITALGQFAHLANRYVLREGCILDARVVFGSAQRLPSARAENRQMYSACPHRSRA